MCYFAIIPYIYIIMKRLLFVLSVFFSLTICAQPYCQVNTYTTRNGIPSNSIVGFGCSSNGLMWFGTLNGLCCYDGHRFINFRNNPDRYDEKALNRQVMIKIDAKDNVWGITYERSVYMFDIHTCQFVDVNNIINRKFGQILNARGIYDGTDGVIWLVSNEGPSYKVDIDKISSGDGLEMVNLKADFSLSNSIKKIECDSNNDEWVFSTNGIIRYSDKFIIEQPIEYMVETAGKYVFATVDGRMYTFSDEGKLLVVGLPEMINQIYALRRIDEEKVILAANSGLYVYNVKAGKLHQIELNTDGKPAELFSDSKKRIWVYTDAGNIVMLNAEELKAINIKSLKGNSVSYTVSDQPLFHEDAKGTLWLATKGGKFGYFDEQRFMHCPLLLSSDREAYGKLATINKYDVDKEKNIWFTSSRDIHHLQFKYDKFDFTDVYSNTEVRSLLADDNKRIWVGTYNGVLAIYDNERTLIGYLNRKGKIQNEITDFAQRIYCLKQDNKGRIWIGTKGNGLFIYDVGNEKLHQYKHNPSEKYSLSYDEIYDMDIDEKGNIWLVTFEGGLNLVRETKEGLRFLNYKNEIPQYPINKYGKIRRVTHDGKGTVILSTNNGLLTFSNSFVQPEDIEFYETHYVKNNDASLYTNDVMQTLVMTNGDVYVLTLGGGVQQAATDNLLQDNIPFKSNEHITSAESIIQSMVEDSCGCLWLIRESSIDKFNPKDGKVIHYGSSSIGDNVEFSEALPAFCKNSDMMLAAARGGFLSFTEESLEKSNYKPNIVFTSLLYQGEQERLPIFNSGHIMVPSDKRNLTIYFSALEYTNNDFVEYAYKLEGYDDDWNYVGDVNNASLSHLSSGTYRLLVKSTNSDGVEVDNVAELLIEVEPTFWETGWAKVIYVLFFMLLAYMIFYVYNLHNRTRMERKLNEMKTEFFTDISHKLRTPLTLIGGPINEVLNANGLSDFARKHLEMVQRNSSQMLELVNKMLKYSMERGVYISDEEIPQASIIKDTNNIDEYNSERQGIASANGDMQSTLLVVEDNSDLRAFLVSILSNEYKVLEAENGHRGLEIAEKEMPDFIITDVMMPVMDGLTMIKNIKKNNDICHIPIIVLSAKASMEDRIEGLKSGIDDYITKPFSATYLKLRVSNIISHRRMLQQAFVEQLTPAEKQTYQLENPEIVNADNEMMKKLMAFLEEHIADPELKIEDLADAVHLGRSVFYGKIKSIVGMTPVDFVRHIRMQRAEVLIAKSDYSFSQIAYMVGFSDPKYFGKCFKKETGMTPSEYRNHKDKD